MARGQSATRRSSAILVAVPIDPGHAGLGDAEDAVGRIVIGHDECNLLRGAQAGEEAELIEPQQASSSGGNLPQPRTREGWPGSRLEALRGQLKVVGV
jgi:hypothetical protein